MKMSDITGKIKEAYRGPRRKFVWFVTLSTAVFLFVWIVGPGNTIIHWVKAGIETRQQERLIEQYEAQNAEMETRLKMLRNDKVKKSRCFSLGAGISMYFFPLIGRDHPLFG